jgi:cyclohexanone monooxygenase
VPHPGGFDAYKRRCDAVAASGYEGFRLTRQGIPVA